MESHRSTVPMAWSTKPPSVSTSQRQRTGDGKANDPIFFTDDDSDNSEDGKGLDNDTAEASIFKEYLGIHGESNADVDLSKIKNLLAASKSGAVSCLICLERVRSIDPVWDCKVGCHAVFHLICIQEWARQASNAAAERSIARLSRDHFPAAASAALESSCWHCPKCRVDYTQSQIPREYRCYCGKVVDPANDPWGTPHTCGEICGRPLPGNCEHECVLLCHPGPCPPCPKLARSKCFCGASSEVRRCGLKDFSCNGRCSKQLSCGLHKCEEKCHRGPCPPCRKNGLYRCLCGKAEKECLCSESEFQCENPCNQELGCRKHRCLKGCHSGPCGECELQGRRTCPCGKVEYRGLSCDGAVPTCGSTCEKMLHCSMHRCPERCHPGPCVDTCRTVTSKSCRCGSLKKQVPCHQDLVCDRKCQRVRDCGRHACKRRCCDGDCPPCSEICGRKLRCNNHKCPAPCHRGTCAPCPVTVRIACSCGETAFEVPCGTEKEQRPPRCSRQCSITPLCRHGPQSKEFRQIGNRENDGAAMLQLYEQLNVDERAVLRQCGLERAAGTRQVMMDRDMLSELVSWWDPERHVFILQQPHRCHYGACPICRLVCNADLSCGHRCKERCHGPRPPAKPEFTLKPKKRKSGQETVGSPGLPCPPCRELVVRQCLGGHIGGERTMICSESSTFGCGKYCGNLLACGNHYCKKPCHLVTVPRAKCPDGFQFYGSDGRQMDSKMEFSSDGKSMAMVDSCDECVLPCQKKRVPTCSHPCPQLCHQGDCEPCKTLIRQACHCGTMFHVFECNYFNSLSQEQQQKVRTCGGPCHRKLPNCTHLCPEQCHPGPCPSADKCRKKVTVRCSCQRLKKEWFCLDVQAAYRNANRSLKEGTRCTNVSGLLPCNEECAKSLEQKLASSEMQQRKPVLAMDKVDQGASTPKRRRRHERVQMKGQGTKLKDVGAKMLKWTSLALLLLLLLAASYFGYKGLMWLSDFMNELDERRRNRRLPRISIT